MYRTSQKIGNRHAELAEVLENRYQLVDDQPYDDDHSKAVIYLYLDTDVHKRRGNQVIDNHTDGDESEVPDLFGDAHNADAA